MILKDNLEQAIVECNLIIQRWMSDRPKLVTYESIRGLVIQHLKKTVNKSLAWREARSFFALRLLYFNFDPEKRYITTVMLTEDAKLVRDPKATTVIELLKGFDYEALGRRSLATPSRREIELEHVSFDNLKSITF